METQNTIALPDLESMAASGVHLGTLRSRSNPKMKPYIWAVKNSFQVIDLEKSRDNLKIALEFLVGVRKKGGIILFVGTGVAAKETPKKLAEELGAPYVAERWLGGTITNFSTISRQVNQLKDLESQKASGGFEKYTKYETLKLEEKMGKLRKEFGGLTGMSRLPDAVWVASANYDKIAVAEANKKNIPIAGLVNTNSDPTLFDYPVPANDTALSSVNFLINLVRDAIINVKPAAPEPAEGKPETAKPEAAGKKNNDKNRRP